MYATEYINLISIYIYDVHVINESKAELIYQNYSFFKCAVDKLYTTAVNTTSNLVTSSSPTDWAQIIFQHKCFLLV